LGCPVVKKPGSGEIAGHVLADLEQPHGNA